jgi:hypothetical protein
MTTKTLGPPFQHLHIHQDEEKKKQRKYGEEKKNKKKRVGKMKGEMMKTTYM